MFIMTFMSKFKFLFVKEDDSAYWDKKAAELTLLGELHRGNLVLGPDDHHRSLAEQAQRAVGHINFEEMLIALDVDTGYRQLSKADITVAIGIGLMGVAAAYATNLNAEALEEQALKLHENFKPDGATSPHDYRSGAKHRYIFGHDFNLGQKFPEGMTFGGDQVGGKSLYQLLLNYIEAHYPGSGVLATHFKLVMHLLTHYLSDLPTNDGLPLPFTSFFTKWKENPLNASGYSAENPVLDALGREFGTIHASDMTSYAVMKLMIKGYKAYTFWGESTSERDKDLHEAQMSTIAYGTTLLIQLFLCLVNAGSGGVVGTTAGATRMTAKFNYLIAGPFLWNASKSVIIVGKQHSEIMKDYEASISCLNDSETSFDTWIKTQCT